MPEAPRRTAAAIRVRVRFFARFRELAGREEATVEIAPGSTVSDLLDVLRGRSGLGEIPVRPAVAVNREYAPPERRLVDDDEVALIPPVAGGSGAPRIRTEIAAEPLQPSRLLEGLGTHEDGAVVLFIGRVRARNAGRRVAALAYEAYREMAERELEAIAREAAEAYGAGAIAAAHRVGELALGEPSVAIAVAAPHRAEAYAASRAVIEMIKERLPVWKRERYADGSEDWVGGTEVRPDAARAAVPAEDGAPAGGTP